ncbi:MAG TPA: AmmeMemoRadiSam system radical SAM enzyme [Bacteroidota bacterium]|nr:AmmeMemoRadiSam system radical SAM enzyme [Bacteroidota bacterium]
MEQGVKSPLGNLLAAHVREGSLYEKGADGRVRCFACGHRCKIAPGKEGICRVRFNEGGVLKVPFGYVGGLAVDPVEKKPFFHVLPGSTALSFGMLGCDYRCGYCQNWITSQALRDPEAIAPVEVTTAGQIVGIALRRKIPIITSTYNEPLITSEWAVEIFKGARPHGIKCSFVSNGNGTVEAIEYLRPHLDFYKVDLKSFRQKNYQSLGGRLDIVLKTIELLHTLGVWVEIVTLVVPGFNDSEGELTDIARYIASVSPSIPWHVTAFHQDYRMTDNDATPVRSLLKSAEIGAQAGLHFVYAGNLPGRVGRWENTYCPSCGELLIERSGYSILRNAITGGSCPKCRINVPGIWK